MIWIVCLSSAENPEQIHYLVNHVPMEIKNLGQIYYYLNMRDGLRDAEL